MKFDKIQKNDKVILKLSKNDISALTDIQDMHDATMQMKRKINRLCQKLYANQVLFWDNILTRSEQAETADNRGKSLNICENNEQLVIVERQNERRPPFLNMMKMLETFNKNVDEEEEYDEEYDEEEEYDEDDGELT